MKPGETQEIDLACTPLKRGKISFPDTKLILPDPLGLFQKTVRLQPDSTSITVLPKRYRLPELVLEGLSRSELGGQSTEQSSGHTDEVAGLREYRQGDPLKHIHWRSWAKTGQPFVREYENVCFPRYGLVLDTACPHANAHLFEEAVSIATSFVRSVETKECLLDLIFLNQGAKVQTVGTGVAKSEEMLELLATVDVDLQPDWRSLAKQVSRYAESLTACIAIFMELDSERERLLQQWHAAGMKVLVIVLTEESSTESKPKEANANVVHISNHRIQADLMEKLARFSV